MENSKQFIKSLAGFSLGPLGAAALQFISVPIQTWLVAPAELGKAAMYTMAFSLTSLFLNLGMDQAYMREYHAEQNKKNLLWNSFLVPFLFSLLLMVIYLFFFEPISMLLFGSIEKYIIKILAFSLPFSVIFKFNTLILRMKENSKAYSLVQISHQLFSVGFTIIILLFFNRSFKGIIQAQFFALILIGALSTLINLNEWKYRIKLDRKLLKKLASFGLPLMPASLIFWILNSMDKVALRTWGTFEDIGMYSAASKIVGVAIVIQSAFTTFWIPTMYRWNENNVALRNYEIVSNKLNSLLTLVFAVVVLFREQIVMILSPEYRKAAIVVPFLMIYPVVSTLSETTSMGITFSRKSYFAIVVSSVSAGLNILGNILLVPKFGVLGASISTGISYIAYFWSRTLISRVLWKKIDIKKHFISIFLMLLMASLSVSLNNFYIDLSIFFIILIYNFKDFLWGLRLIKTIMIKIKNDRILKKLKKT